MRIRPLTHCFDAAGQLGTVIIALAMDEMSGGFSSGGRGRTTGDGAGTTAGTTEGVAVQAASRPTLSKTERFIPRRTETGGWKVADTADGRSAGVPMICPAVG
jgi:hypothetical protein